MKLIETKENNDIGILDNHCCTWFEKNGRSGAWERIGEREEEQ